MFAFHVSIAAGFEKRTLPPIHLFGRTFTGILSPLSLGSSGVHLFFVISGFCLALQQWRAGQPTMPTGALARYARGRLARIGPAYWLTVLLSAALAAATHDIAAAWLLRDTALHLTFLHGFDHRTFLSLHGGLWSMATEVQFYAVFPALLILYHRLGGLAFLAALAVLNLGFRLLLALHPAFHGAEGAAWAPVLAYQLPGRVVEFGLGMVLAELYLRRRQEPAAVQRAHRQMLLALAPTLLVALYLRAFGPPYLPDLGLGAFYFLLCGAIVLRPQPETAAPSALADWSARFGRASYSFFLIHYPVMLILADLLPLPADAPWTRFAALFATSLPLSTLCAVALYLGVELPAWRRLRA